MIQQHFRLIDIRWTSLGLRAAASSGSRMMKRSLGIIFKIIVKIFIGSVCGPFENGWYLYLKIQEKTQSRQVGGGGGGVRTWILVAAD